MAGPGIVLISGASSGIGRATGRLLAERGWLVFGGSRGPAGPTADGLTMLPLEVGDESSARAAVAEVERRVGRLDALVASAGVTIDGALEEASRAEAGAVMEVNYWGVVRLVDAALPLLRRQGSGRIVAIGSLAGQIGLPFGGHYSASKFALEGYCQALRHELRPFGIHVSLVVPGVVRTALRERRLRPAARLPEYDRARERAESARGRAAASDPALVARVVHECLSSASPRLHYYAGPDAGLFAIARRLAPEGLLERLIRRRLRLDE